MMIQIYTPREPERQASGETNSERASELERSATQGEAGRGAKQTSGGCKEQMLLLCGGGCGCGGCGGGGLPYLLHVVGSYAIP